MTDLPRHSVSVTGVVFRDDSRWVPPGGVLELDETPTEGVTREGLEETGINVRADQLTGVYKNMKLGA